MNTCFHGFVHPGPSTLSMPSNGSSATRISTPRCGRWYTATAVGIRIARPSTQSANPNMSETPSTTMPTTNEDRGRATGAGATRECFHRTPNCTGASAGRERGPRPRIRPGAPLRGGRPTGRAPRPSSVFSSQVIAPGGSVRVAGGGSRARPRRGVIAGRATPRGRRRRRARRVGAPAATSTSAGSVLAITGAPNVRASSSGKPEALLEGREEHHRSRARSTSAASASDAPRSQTARSRRSSSSSRRVVVLAVRCRGARARRAGSPAASRRDLRPEVEQHPRRSCAGRGRRRRARTASSTSAGTGLGRRRRELACSARWARRRSSGPIGASMATSRSRVAPLTATQPGRRGACDVRYWRGRNSRFGERRLVGPGDGHEVVDRQHRRQRGARDEVLGAVHDLARRPPRTSAPLGTAPTARCRAGRPRGTVTIASRRSPGELVDAGAAAAPGRRRRAARRPAPRARRRAPPCSGRSRPDGRSCRPARRRAGRTDRRRLPACRR